MNVEHIVIKSYLSRAPHNMQWLIVNLSFDM